MLWYKLFLSLQNQNDVLTAVCFLFVFCVCVCQFYSRCGHRLLWALLVASPRGTALRKWEEQRWRTHLNSVSVVFNKGIEKKIAVPFLVLS